MDKNQILNEIFASDPLNILEVKPKSSIISNDDRLLSSFGEINDFYEKNNREPEKSSDRIERQLYSRLQGIRENQDKIDYLKEHDKYNLLHDAIKQPEINSIDDIFNNDLLGVFEEKEDSIFKIKNVPEIDKDRSDPDFVARRKLCPDFYKYEDGFKKCQEDLKNGKRVLNVFRVKSEIKEGVYLVLNGVLLFINKIGNLKTDAHGNIDGRLHCIFENGTESRMLLMSLWRALVEDNNGRIVSENIDDTMNRLHMISEDDNKTGYIYILKSLSKDEKISTIKDLYKIGFSTTSVEERVKNAERDPTYLMAPVKIVEVFQCYNMNPQKLENLIHKFFGKVCLNLDMFDNNGNRYIPREWFVVPLDIIIETIDMIIDGSIVKYVYDEEREVIVER